MLTALIIARNRTFAEEVAANLQSSSPPGGLRSAVTMLSGQLEAEDLPGAFAGLCDWIEGQSSLLLSSGPPRLLVVSDVPGSGGDGWTELNPVGPTSWPTLLGMLILAFPEAHFVLPRGTGSETWHEIGRDLDVSASLRLLSSGYSPLFDAGGLRRLVRGAARDWLAQRWKVSADAVMPERSRAVAAIDEEEGHAFFHAYVGYRFGFRAHVVKSYRTMRQLFADDGCNVCGVFEDVYLSFSDAPPSGLSKLEDRDQILPGLLAVPYRIFVTRDLGHKNREYFVQRRGREERWQEIAKPVAGVFSLSTDWVVNDLFATSGYKWPFDYGDASESDSGGHSAPGRLLAVSERLLRRAERLFLTARSVPAAVQGAVLATDALELLGGRTPTASLEALSWKHQFEVLAESLFLGMEDDIDLEQRFADIRAELNAIAGQVAEDKRQFFKNTAEAQIVGKLIQVFRSLVQFEEEQACIARAREVHLRIRYSNRIALAPVKWFKMPVCLLIRYSKRVALTPVRLLETYVNWLLEKFPRFCGFLVVWVLALSLAYAVTRPGSCDPSLSYLECLAGRMTYGLGMTLTSFFSAGAPVHAEDYLGDVASVGVMFARRAVVGVSILGGLLHLGVFLSHLYGLVSRK